MRLCACLVLMILIACLGAVGADEFEWSWDKAEPAAAEEVKTAPAEKKDFEWAWEKGAKPAAPVAGKPVGINIDEYNELLKENLSLREKISEVRGEKAAAEREAAKLSREIRDMEGRIATFAGEITKLKAEKTAPAMDPDRIVDLETRLKQAESEKARLATELSGLQEQAEAIAVARATPAPPETPAPDSELFQRVEKENARLKAALTTLEDERRKALAEKEQALAQATSATGSEDELRAELAQAQQDRDAHQKAVKLMLKKIPALEKELADAKQRASNRGEELSKKELALKELKTELEQRERRLVKAARMLNLLEDARVDVHAVDNSQMRDMHYNMAQQFVEQERFRDAEKEYLRALRIDASDADVHYNIAVLYDDELEDRRRAAMHYRKYLKLRPDAEDAAQVSEWIDALR